MSIWHIGMVKTASWLVPEEQRTEWLAEWKGELWQLQDNRTQAAIFCLGSFRDAVWLWRNKPLKPGTRLLKSPAHCLLFLLTVAALSLFFALRLPDIPIAPAMAKSLPRPPLDDFWMITGMACLILPAVTSLSLGEYPTKRYLLRRWMFLAAKIVLILPPVYSGCVYLVYQYLAHYRFPIPIQVLLAGIILAFRWVLNDQRQRCPVCLRLLGNAAKVGQPARNFLEWNGTELVCARGHGLLHIPATPANWSVGQRWLDLDPSWSSLF
jgi:hypothetical protein